jgi:uncharacterized protein (TIGR00290 family)
MDSVVLSWSGGKDAAYALYVLRNEGTEVIELLTTINEAYDRSTMHGVHRSLYDRQAAAVGLDVNFVTLPPDPSNDEYERIMAQIVEGYRERGVERIGFADLYLEDVRAYRERQLDGTGVEGYWPLWGRDTTDMAREFLDAGFRATVVAVDGDALDESFAGREFDAAFLDDLPASVDPCGENGEFHTFVWDGPVFETPVAVETGETVTRTVGDGEFHYCDLRLTDSE